MQALTLARSTRSTRVQARTVRTSIRPAAVDRSLVAGAAAFVVSTLLVLAMPPALASVGTGPTTVGPMPMPAPAPSCGAGSVPGPLPAPGPDLLSGPDELGPTHV